MVAEQLVRDAAARDGAGWIGRFVPIVRAHVGPERIRVANERGPGIGLQDRRERAGIARAPGALVREVIDLLEMDQQRYAQVGRERVNATQLRTIGRHVELQFTETLGSIL